MPKKNNATKQLKRLYNQLGSLQEQPLSSEKKVFTEKTAHKSEYYLTRRGRIEHNIRTLEQSKSKS